MSHSIITLLSDFGTRDASVAIAKGILQQYAPDATVVDISHNVAQYDLQQAAYILLSSYRHFPKGAIHVCPVDVFSGDTPRILLAEKDGFRFIMPDNGILPLTFGADAVTTMLCMEFTKPFLFSDWMNSAGHAVQSILAGTLPFPVYTVTEAPRRLQPVETPDGVDCSVLYIDHYENVVLNITRAQFDALIGTKQFKIMIPLSEDITVISHNYNDVLQDDALCRFNNAGFLEIAINHASAATLLGLNTENRGNKRHRPIKIYTRF